MTFDDLRAIAKVSQEGWVVTWTSKGWVISKGLDPAMQLTAARGGLRYIKSLTAVGNIMADKIGVHTYTVHGRAPQQEGSGSILRRRKTDQ